MKTFITQNEMDCITETVLLNAGSSPSWQGYITKTNIDSIVEFTYGLEFVWEDINYLSAEESILAAICPQKRIIIMNRSMEMLFKQKPGVMNFTKAHELGHWILHVTKQQEYQQLSFMENEKYFCRGGKNRPPEEFQADMFAASILMPRDIIISAINILKNNEKITFVDLYNMSSAFEVSISSLTKRIQDLNLLVIKDKHIFFTEAEAFGQLALF